MNALNLQRIPGASAAIPSRIQPQQIDLLLQELNRLLKCVRDINITGLVRTKEPPLTYLIARLFHDTRSHPASIINPEALWPIQQFDDPLTIRHHRKFAHTARMLLDNAREVREPFASEDREPLFLDLANAKGALKRDNIAGYDVKEKLRWFVKINAFAVLMLTKDHPGPVAVAQAAAGDIFDLCASSRPLDNLCKTQIPMWLRRHACEHLNRPLKMFLDGQDPRILSKDSPAARALQFCRAHLFSDNLLGGISIDQISALTATPSTPSITPFRLCAASFPPAASLAEAPAQITQQQFLAAFDTVLDELQCFGQIAVTRPLPRSSDLTIVQLVNFLFETRSDKELFKVDLDELWPDPSQKSFLEASCILLKNARASGPAPHRDTAGSSVSRLLHGFENFADPNWLDFSLAERVDWFKKFSLLAGILLRDTNAHSRLSLILTHEVRQVLEDAGAEGQDWLRALEHQHKRSKKKPALVQNVLDGIRFLPNSSLDVGTLAYSRPLLFNHLLLGGFTSKRIAASHPR